ncbi:MAG TPA: hypothetical protein VFK36_01025 [Gemmatimonadales bacterium]|nr:hypothetical protein [Gemmatimonadales bacterium]
MPVVYVIVGLVTVTLRLVPGMLWRYRGMDAGAHLLLRRHIRSKRMRLTIDGWPLVLDRRFTYPWVYHWLLALLPEPWLRRVPPLPSALCDVLHATIGVWLAGHLAPMIMPATPPGHVSLLAGLLFGTSPALLVAGFGPRAYEVTPRPFGELLYTATMAGALLYLVEGSAVGACVALMSGGLLLLSSKFAAQVLLFCTPVVALLARDARLLLLLPGAALVAMAVSGGGYWWILQTQWVHLRYYRRTLQYQHPALIRRNRGRDLVRAVGSALASPRERASWTRVVQLAEAHTFLQFLLRNVLWCGVVLLYVTGLVPAGTGTGAAWVMLLWAWTLAPLLPFLFSSMRDFRFLGEAERYPEYAVTPAAILGAMSLLALPPGQRSLALLGYVATLIVAETYTVARLRWNARRQRSRSLDELVAFLSQFPAGTVVVPLPWLLAYQLAPDVSCAFVAGIDAKVWCEDTDGIFALYPWLRPDVSQWARKYSASAVMVDRAALQSEAAPDYDFTALQLAFENDGFQVYRWP